MGDGWLPVVCKFMLPRPRPEVVSADGQLALAGALGFTSCRGESVSSPFIVGRYMGRVST